MDIVCPLAADVCDEGDTEVCAPVAVDVSWTVLADDEEVDAVVIGNEVDVPAAETLVETPVIVPVVIPLDGVGLVSL